MEMEFTHAALEYDATITIEHLTSSSTDNLVLHLFVTESGILDDWGNPPCMLYCNNINRLMVPNQFGTSLDFSGGDVVEVDLSFAMDSDWNVENCELIAFIQNTVTHEVHQATLSSMAIPDYDIDAEVYKIENVPEGNCTGLLSPIVTIKNWGAERLTSLTINYLANNEDLHTYNWTGDLDFLDESKIDLEEFGFELGDLNEFMVYSSMPNGVPDENPVNDTLTQEFGYAFMSEFYRISLLLKVDDFPQQTTYEVKDDAGNLLYSGGPFEQPNAFVRDTFNLYNSGCYQFILNDSGGDGLAGGFYVVREAFVGGATIKSGGDFGTKETTEFSIDWVGVDDIELSNEIRIYPNPFENETNILLNVESNEEVIVKVYNTLGELTFEKNFGILPEGENAIKLRKEDFTTGINLVQIQIGEQSFVEKVMLER